MNFNAKSILAKKNAKEAHVCLNASYKGMKHPGYKQDVNH